MGLGCLLGDGVRPTAIGPTCELGDYVKVNGGVRLGAGSRLGDYVILGHATKAETTGFDPASGSTRIADCLVEDAVTAIGERATIRSHGVIYHHVRIGADLITGHHLLIREHVTIGRRCVFGSYASCDGYAALGDDVHVGQYAQLSQAVRIGNGVFIGGHTVFSDNPTAVRRVENDLIGAVIEDHVRIGLNCVLLPGVRVGRDAMIGAGSVITKDIPSGVLAFGNPCRVVRDLSADEIEVYHRSVHSYSTK